MSWRLHTLSWLLGMAAALSTPVVLPGQAWGQNQAPALTGRALWVGLFVGGSEWRDDDFRGRDSPIVLGILGDDPLFKKEIEPLRTWTFQKRKVEVRECGSVEEATACHVVFICSSEKRRLASTLKPLRGRRILTISDAEGFFKEGGIASVTLKQTGLNTFIVVPDVNQRTLSHGEWKFNSDLFRLLANSQKVK